MLQISLIKDITPYCFDCFEIHCFERNSNAHTFDYCPVNCTLTFTLKSMSSEGGVHILKKAN